MRHGGVKATVIVWSVVLLLFVAALVASIAFQTRSISVTPHRPSISEDTTLIPAASPMVSDSEMAIRNHLRQSLSLDQFKQRMHYGWSKPPPTKFDPNVPLGMIQSLVYAFPGYQYHDLTVEVTDGSTVAGRVNGAPQTAKQPEFIFSVLVKGSLDTASLDADSYAFSFTYSANDDQYTLLAKDFDLKGVPSDIESMARQISSSTIGKHEILSAGWIKESGGHFSYPGATDGTIYLVTKPFDLSGPELSLPVPENSLMIFYVDVLKLHRVVNFKIEDNE